MGLESSGYMGLVLKILTQAGIDVSDRIRIISNGKDYEGILIPRAQVGSDPDHIVVKLDTGYNVGVRIGVESHIELVKRGKKRKSERHSNLPKANPDLPTVAILSTGGTIASKVDYKTGAVNPALSAQDLYDTVPELNQHARVIPRILMSLLSENIQPADWSIIAKEVASEIRKGVDGIVIAHGTDTITYTSAALSFALQEMPVPVALVGSQRSSDRPSSDAAINLIGATDLVGRVDAAEVMVVMHGQTDDSFVHAHRGTRVRKSHTSRRDAFQSINFQPLFKVEGSQISEITQPLLRRNPERKLRLKPKFDDNVALLKTYPGIRGEFIDNFVECGIKGIVIEGTGLGHASEHIHLSIKNAIESGVVVAMTSQCISGRVDMNVYRPGVEMLQMGVIPCENMLAETAVVKLMWLLANNKSVEKVSTQMGECIVGEMDSRTEQREYDPH